MDLWLKKEMEKSLNQKPKDGDTGLNFINYYLPQTIPILSPGFSDSLISESWIRVSKVLSSYSIIWIKTK